MGDPKAKPGALIPKQRHERFGRSQSEATSAYTQSGILSPLVRSLLGDLKANPQALTLKVEYYLHWYEAFWEIPKQSETTSAYTQSGILSPLVRGLLGDSKAKPSHERLHSKWNTISIGMRHFGRSQISWSSYFTVSFFSKQSQATSAYTQS